MTLVLKLLIKLIDLLIILIAPNLMGPPVCLVKTQLIKSILNSLNHLLKLRHNGIKLLLLQKYSTYFSWKKLAQKNISRNNPDTQQRICFISNTNFSTCTCPVYLRRPAENYETLHGLVSSRKLSGNTTKKPAKGIISRPLL